MNYGETRLISTNKFFNFKNPETGKVEKIFKYNLVNIERRFESDICNQMNITKKSLRKKLKKDSEFKEEFIKLKNNFYKQLKESK